MNSARKLILATLLIFGLVACQTTATIDTRNFFVPERPKVRVLCDAGHCQLTDGDMRRINLYIMDLETAVNKYRCQVAVEHGGNC